MRLVDIAWRAFCLLNLRFGKNNRKLKWFVSISFCRTAMLLQFVLLLIFFVSLTLHCVVFYFFIWICENTCHPFLSMSYSHFEIEFFQKNILFSTFLLVMSYILSPKYCLHFSKQMLGVDFFCANGCAIVFSQNNIKHS